MSVEEDLKEFEKRLNYLLDRQIKFNKNEIILSGLIEERIQIINKKFQIAKERYQLLEGRVRVLEGKTHDHVRGVPTNTASFVTCGDCGSLVRTNKKG